MSPGSRGFQAHQPETSGMAILGQIEVARRPGCPSCGKVLSPPAVGKFFRCPHCAQPLRVPSQGQPLETLACVACSGRLVAYAGADGQLVIDFCSSCEGFWFDGDELQKLVTRPELVDTFPLPPRGQQAHAFLAAAARRCPRCDGRELKPVQLADVTLDHCPQCRGSWLDSGELERLAEQHRASTQPAEVRPSDESWLRRLVSGAFSLLGKRA